MDSQKLTLVVIGATGNQGKPVLEYFAKNRSRYDFHLRGITRNAESKTAKYLTSLGIEMFEADLDDVKSLHAAFSGATHIFATTDSNQIIYSAAGNPSVLSPGQSPTSYAHEKELIQGQNLADAIAATSAGTLRRLVWSNLPSPKKWSRGKYTKVDMFDAKEDIAEILASKKELKEKLSYLYIGFYAANALLVPKMYAPKKQADGTYELTFPMSGDIAVPIADLDKDMGPWVAALLEAEPGVHLLGSTEHLTWKQWLEKWAHHNTVKAQFRRDSGEEFDRIFLPGISEAVLEEFAFLEEYGFKAGNPNLVLPDDLRRRGIALVSSTIDDHISRSDWSSIL